MLRSGRTYRLYKCSILCRVVHHRNGTLIILQIRIGPLPFDELRCSEGVLRGSFFGRHHRRIRYFRTVRENIGKRSVVIGRRSLIASSGLSKDMGSCYVVFAIRSYRCNNTTLVLERSFWDCSIHPSVGAGSATSKREGLRGYLCG